MILDQIVCMDALQYLRSLPDKCVNSVATSPPYYDLRDYQVEGQIGNEQTPQAYVDRLIAVFSEINRVLADDGTIWVNLGGYLPEQTVTWYSLAGGFRFAGYRLYSSQ